METLAGIDSTTIARMLVDIEQGNGLVPGSVLIVDEAGVVGSRTIDNLARHAAETESKLVLVGDDRQLPEIDAGAASVASRASSVRSSCTKFIDKPKSSREHASLRGRRPGDRASQRSPRRRRERHPRRSCWC
jgi:ATP-dependent exoDNAse (exonuclease V) alpha subunit